MVTNDATNSSGQAKYQCFLGFSELLPQSNGPRVAWKQRACLNTPVARENVRFLWNFQEK